MNSLRSFNQLEKLNRLYPEYQKIVSAYQKDLYNNLNNLSKLDLLFMYFFIRNFTSLIRYENFKPDIMKTEYYRFGSKNLEKLLNNKQYNFFGKTIPPLEIILELMLEINYPLSKLLPRNYLKLILKKLFNKKSLQPLEKEPYEDITKFFIKKTESKKYKQIKFYPYDKEKYRKIRFASKSPDEYLSRTIKHYVDFFGEIDNYKPGIFLTTSGMEANNIIANFFAHKYSENFVNQSYQKGWYTETTDAIKFDEFYSPEKNILWAENLNFDGNTKEFLNEITNFIQIAKDNPHTEYYLVWDKTGLLDFEHNELLKNIPKNLKVIITSSLTKFQKGETNFFFGIIAFYNFDKQDQENLTKIYENISFFPQTTLSKIFFPRLKKTQVKEMFKNIENNKKAFKKYLNPEIIVKENRIGLTVKSLPKNLLKKLFIMQFTFGLPYTNISHKYTKKNNNNKLLVLQRISFGIYPENDLEEKANLISKYYKKNKYLFGNLVF